MMIYQMWWVTITWVFLSNVVSIHSINTSRDVALIIGGYDYDGNDFYGVEIYTGHLPDPGSSCIITENVSIPDLEVLEVGFYWYGSSSIFVPDVGVFVCGGLRWDNLNPRCVKFPDSKFPPQWETIPSELFARHRAAIVSGLPYPQYGEGFWILGGDDGKNDTSTVTYEIVDTSNGVARDSIEMNGLGRRDHCAAHLNNEIFVIGGHHFISDSYVPTSKIDIFCNSIGGCLSSPEPGNWTVIDGPSSGRSKCTSFSFEYEDRSGEAIIIIQGVSRSAEVDILWYKDGQLVLYDNEAKFQFPKDSANSWDRKIVILDGWPVYFGDYEREYEKGEVFQFSKNYSHGWQWNELPAQKMPGSSKNVVSVPEEWLCQLFRETTENPSDSPTENPSDSPTIAPTENPTDTPTENPSDSPTNEPTENPTDTPTKKPTSDPTEHPTDDPTEHPTSHPTEHPTDDPTENPTDTSTEHPTDSPTERPTDDDHVVNLLSDILLSISGAFIIVTQVLLALQKVDARTKNRKIVETNRNVNLCLAQLAFVISRHLGDLGEPVFCQLVGGLNHALWLAVFTWTGLEAYLYYEFLSPVVPERRMPQYLLGYGIPAIIVAITASVAALTGQDLYLNLGKEGDPQLCFLSRDGVAIWAFVGPVAVTVVFNLVIVVMAVRVAYKPANRRSVSKQPIGNILLLTTLLAITWILGFNKIFTPWLPEESGLVADYMFVILNGSIGIYIFFYTIIMNKQVRDNIKQRITTQGDNTIKTKN